jgi:dolichol-phosphate hexosyltransferase
MESPKPATSVTVSVAVSRSYPCWSSPISTSVGTFTSQDDTGTLPVSRATHGTGPVGLTRTSLERHDMATIGNDTVGLTAVGPLRPRLGVLVEVPAPGEHVRSSPNALKLSIVMPAYNEQATIRTAIERLLAIEFPCDVELIVVNDGSTDGTALELDLCDDPRLVRCTHPFNLGKGTAVRTGAATATGTHLLIFDADVEYDPKDIPELVAPIIDGTAEVVYGARIFGNHTVYPSMRFAIGNRVTTLAANLLFDSYITDLHTCLKLIPLNRFRELKLTERGFGLDSEITAELLRRGVRPFEIPVSYSGRSRAQGKKITWRDGVGCLYVLAKVRSRRIMRA